MKTYAKTGQKSTKQLISSMNIHDKIKELANKASNQNAENNQSTKYLVNSFSNYTEEELTKLIKHNFLLTLKKNLAKIGNVYVENNQNRYYTQLLAEYFSNNPKFNNYRFSAGNINFNYNTLKSLFLVGSPGRSKSEYMNIFNNVITRLQSSQKFITLYSKDIANDFEKKGAEAISILKVQYSDKHLCIEELGLDPTTIKHFSNEYRPLEDIIEWRYRLFTTRGIKTHFVSMFSLEMLQKKYQPHIYSRLLGMTNYIIIDDINYRPQISSAT